MDEIDKAIALNDDRAELSQIWRNCASNVKPSKSFCNIVYENDCELILQLAERMHSALPIIAQVTSLNGPRPTHQNNLDWAFIGRSECSEESVTRINSDIISLMNSYDNLFENLETRRDELAQVTDVFGNSLAQTKFYVGDYMDLPTYEASKNIYRKTKNELETIINDFQMTISDYRLRLSRLLARRKAMRIGWGFKTAHQDKYFMVLVRYKPLSFKKAVETDDRYRAEMWVPPISKNPRKPTPYPRRFDKRETNETNLAVTNVSCVTEVESLVDFSDKLLTTNFSYHVFSFIEEDNVLAEKIDRLDMAFFMWLRTTRGWYPSKSDYEVIRQKFQAFLNLCRNSEFNLKTRVKVIDQFTLFFKLEMNMDLKWYYFPKTSYTSVINYITMYTTMIKS